MTIPVWLGVFAVIAVVSLISFLILFIKDSRLRVENGQKSTVLLVDFGLFFVTLLAIAAAIFLYLNWQEQINYFLNN